MFLIPSELIALLTFPGVIMHEIAHRFMCDILQVPVYHVTYFSIGSTQAGHVYHGKTNNSEHDLLIGLAPLLINSFFCIIFTLPYSSTMHIAGEGISNYSDMFLYWVGISIGANAFPSDQDVQNVLPTAERNSRSLFTILLCDLIKGLNRLRFFWINFIYAGVISFILPFLIFGKCANHI